MEIKAQKNVEVFCCYARKDQSLLLELKTHLTPLQREGLITLWADVDINAGAEWEEEIHHHLNSAQIILLLISPDFIASEYCYSIEMQRAIERHERGEAQVIPVILRPVSWQRMPFGKFQALPTNAVPVTSGKWHSQDDAFYEVAEGIRGAVAERACKAEEERVRKAAEVEQARLAEAERARKAEEERIRRAEQARRAQEEKLAREEERVRLAEEEKHQLAQPQTSAQSGMSPPLSMQPAKQFTSSNQYASPYRRLAFPLVRFSLLVYKNSSLEKRVVWGFLSGAVVLIIVMVVVSMQSYNSPLQVKLRAATATAVAVNPYPSYLPGNGVLALYDPLSYPDHWDNHSYASYGTAYQFTQGAYHISQSKPGAFYPSDDTAASDYFSDFAFEVQMTITKGDCGGTMFRRAATTDTEYFFQVCQDRSYELYLYQNSGNNAQSLTGGASAAIHMGYNQSNVIAVVARGSSISLYVNSQQIGSANDATYNYGGIALCAVDYHNPTEVIYSNARAWSL